MYLLVGDFWGGTGEKLHLSRVLLYVGGGVQRAVIRAPYVTQRNTHDLTHLGTRKSTRRGITCITSTFEQTIAFRSCYYDEGASPRGIPYSFHSFHVSCHAVKHYHTRQCRGCRRHSSTTKIHIGYISLPLWSRGDYNSAQLFSRIVT